MSFNPILANTDYSTLSAEQIIAQKKKIAEETRKLDEVLKAKMEEQRAGFVQNVAEQVQALEIMPHDFITSFKQLMKMGEGSAYTAKEIFDTIPENQLEQWFSDFNELKNEYFRSKKTPFFKLPKRTVAGISDTKFSTIYFEDIGGGEKGLKAIAEKIALTREEAITKLFETVDKENDTRVKTVLDMLYPEPKPTPAPAKKK
jgi:hypothetical protein